MLRISVSNHDLQYLEAFCQYALINRKFTTQYILGGRNESSLYIDLNINVLSLIKHTETETRNE